MPKIIFATLVYNGDYVLRECLQSLMPYGDVVVAEGPVDYFAKKFGVTTSTDNTNAILKELGVPVIRGPWREKDEMMRATEPFYPKDTTHVWMVDSDEIFKKEDIEFVLSQLDQWDSVSFKPLTFFGGFRHVLTGFEQRFVWYRIQRWYPGASWNTHRPPTVLAPDGKPWREHRHWNCPIEFFHYSYVWPSQVKSKTEYYQTRSDTIPDYFHSVWLKWKLGTEQERNAIEQKYQGVHEWKPQARGDCFTEEFKGKHPTIIQANMMALQERLSMELREYQ